jgi:hypothetical protein
MIGIACGEERPKKSSLRKKQASPAKSKHSLQFIKSARSIAIRYYGQLQLTTGHSNRQSNSGTLLSRNERIVTYGFSAEGRLLRYKVIPGPFMANMW